MSLQSTTGPFRHARTSRPAAISDSNVRALFDAVGEPMFLHDTLGAEFIDANDAAAASFGLSREELLAMDAGAISSGRDGFTGERAAEFVRRAATGERQSVEWEFRRPDGSLFWGEVRLSRLVIDGRARVLAQFHDITARKATETALARSEQLFRAVFESAELGIAVLGAQGCFVTANPAWLDMLGYSLDELQKMSPLEIDFPESEGDDDGFLERLLAGDEHVARLERRLRRKDGGCVPARLVLTALPVPVDSARAFLVLAEDIGERRRAEERSLVLERRLLQAQKMEAMGTLAGGLAHELNNVLTPIIGYSTEALELAAHDETAALCLREVLKASHRARDLVGGVLTFSRKAEPRLDPLDIAAATRDACGLLGAMLPSTIRLELTVRAEGSVILANQTHIHQLVMNLGSNAAHSMAGSGGRLLVELTARPAAEGGTASWIELSVSDTGHGIAPDVRERIFDPFFTTKKAGEGTGMGLAVVHGIVTALKGRIEVESGPGQGTRFRIFLPLHEGRIPPQAAIEAAAERARGRVLFVDDDPSIAMLVEKQLAKLGYEAAVMTDPAAAAERFIDGPADFDVVVTDQIMPGLTGLELARLARAARPDIPLVLCSGFSELDHFAAEHHALFDAFVRKPFKKEELARALSATLKPRRAALRG